ncbi:Phosphatidylglycerol/phosphatidylinositol transfer protein [Ceratobasidium sp. 394]|nr:Phosphatidylglycerol/phosphatidylinositol transfer protein [Ceratobasidium sp. 394]KAG9076077.1 Phosphatidylglycerol/phosphatidylinositol transfer protein [Ceratobasidium sp. UAMH 11750]
MLFTKFSVAATALLFPLSTFALSLTRPGALAFKLNDQSPISVTNDWSWVDCGLEGDAVKIKSIEVSPDPPKPGKDLTVTVAGRVDTQIEEGAYADVVVKLGLIKLLQKRFDICEEARSNNISVQCPIEKGDYNVTHTVSLPREISPAKFTVSVRAYTADEDDLLCLNLKADFLPKPSYLS